MLISIGLDIAWETALALGGLIERSWVDARRCGMGELTFRISYVLGAVNDLVVGSRSEEGRELGALRKLIVETEELDRWPPNRFENWRLRRDAKVSVKLSFDLGRLTVLSPGR